MRLTLRNLLAYRHGLLSPQDAEELAKKIEESPFAQELLERISDVLRRRTLDAPEVDERRGVLDANTVAEYLDHVLPPDRVPDLERICLESDEQLAEVASCHLILTKVLTEPVEISPASFERMYSLVAQPAKPAIPPGDTQEPVSTTEEAPPAVVAPAERPAKELHKATASWMPFALRLVGSVLLGAVGLGFGMVGLFLLTGQLQPESPLMAFLRGESRQPAARQPVSPSLPPEPLAAPAGGESQIPATPEKGPPPEESGQASAPIEGEPPAAEVSAQTPPVAASQKVEPQQSAHSSVPEGTAPASPAPAEAEPLQQPEGILREFGPVEKPPAMPAESPAPVAEASAPSATPSQPAVTEVLGPPAELLTPQEIILVYDEATSTWRRPAETRLIYGQDYLALPAFVPLIRIGPQTLVKLLGPTKWRLVPSGAGNTLRLQVAFGRLLVRDLPEGWTFEVAEPVGLRVVAGESGNIWALEVYGRHAGPKAPPKDPARAATLFWMKGTGQVQAGNSTRELAEPSQIPVGGQAPPEPLTANPEWTAWEGRLGSEESLGRPLFAEPLPSGEPVLVALRNLAKDRRQEVRMLALRALHCIEEYEPLVEALGNRDERFRWTEWMDRLAQAYKCGSPAREKILAAVERCYNEDGLQVAQWVWDSEEEPSPEVLSNLVDILRRQDSGTSKNIALRVMALWRLRQLAGADFSYRPEDLPANQRSAIKRWDDWLRKRVGSQIPLVPSP